MPVRVFDDVKNTTKMSYGKVEFVEGVSLFDALETITKRSKQSEKPLTYEDLDVDYGFILYQSKIDKTGYLNLSKVNDRANIFVNQKYIKTIQRNGGVSLKNKGKLDILVENEGRICYDAMFNELKGLYQGVKLDNQELTNWNHYGFNLSNINELKFSSNLPTKVPSFYKGYFQVDEVGDTFLNPTGFTKGMAFVNCNNIGRYWLMKPQLTLYAPQSFLHEGKNELVIFELESQSDTIATMSFDDEPQIDIK